MSSQSDLFDEKTRYKRSHREAYGSNGELKKTQYVLQLLGSPWDPNTLKCLMMAAEQGMEMVCGTIDTRKGENQSAAYLQVSEFGLVPCLKENDFVVAGTDAIMSFIDKRGLGNSLAPRRSIDAAVQGFWIDIATCELDKRVRILVNTCLLEEQPTDTDIPHVINELTIVLDALEKQLKHNEFIIGKRFSWADIHWECYLHLISLTPAKELIDERPNIKQWLSRLQMRKSNCGQNIQPYSLLPTVEQIRDGQLPAVRITDF